jgi:PAS domain S-box-containing protein
MASSQQSESDGGDGLDTHSGEQQSSFAAQLRKTLNMVPAYTWYAAPTGALTFVNERTADYLGLSRDHPLRFGIDTGAAWDSHIPLLHPDDDAETRRVWSTCLRTGSAGEASFRVRSAEGEYRWFLSRTEPLRASDGTLLYWIGINLEIEERKQAEFYLSEGERLAQMGSWGLDPAGFFPYWSHELFHVYGLNPAKEGPSLEEYLTIIHPQDREFMRSLISRMFAEASGCDVTKRIVRPDGEVRYIHCVAVPIVQNGALKRIVGTAMDVTEHEHLTQELRRRESYLAEAQKLSHTGSFAWTVQTGEIVWSDETFRIFEFDPSVRPTLELILERLHPEDRARLQQIIDRAPGGQDFEIEYRLLMPDGRVKYLRISAHALTRSSGDLEFVGAVTDVTEAKETEDRIRRIINTVPGLHWSARPDGWVDFINQRWLDYTGMTLERALGWGWTPAYHPDEIEEVQVKWRTAVAEGKPLEMETRLRRFDGEYRWFLERVFPLFDHAGQILGWYGSDIDIHDRKQAEEALKESEQQWHDVFENNPTMYFMMDAAGAVLAVNPYGAEQLGYNGDELVGQPVLNVFYEPDREAARRNVAKCLQQLGQSMSWELRKVRKDGSVIWVRDTARAVLRANEPVVLIACEDITERRSAEDKIRQQEIELRQMLDLTPQHVHVLAADATLVYTNEVALEYHGLTLDEWKERPFTEWRADEVPFKVFHPDDRERLMGELKDKFISGSPHETEARLLREDGKYRWFLFRFNPLRDRQGCVMRWYVAGTDIEDRKQAEEKLQQENAALREEINQASMFEEIVGSSGSLQKVLVQVSKVAITDSTVLILGETGTGKELIARAIHKRSKRAARAFIGVNCGAIPASLIASELFGHEKGAFTGATQRRLGRFEAAHGGTIFVDEVGDLPPDIQIALLRVLQEREIERVGGDKPIPVDIRVLAATHRDLEKLVSEGKFRQDLFYRLNVVPIRVPSLRERSADIPVLAEYFIARFGKKIGKKFGKIEKKTLKVLQAYEWPGNVRELQNVIERAVTLSDSDTFAVEEAWLKREQSEVPHSSAALSGVLVAHEREAIEAALAQSHGRVSGPAGAAAKLGIPTSTLDSKIKRLGIDKYRFKSSG